MARDTNFHNTVIAYLKQLNAVVSSGASTGATEQTALDILAALTNINTNLTDNTNTLLAEIRDSNVTQEALITATNNLLTQINADIITLHNDNVITNDELSDINTELDNVVTILNNISTQDAIFHNDLLNCLDLIKTSLNNIDNNTDELESKLDTLIGQTDQVETLLTTINSTLNTNSSLNVAKLEEIRVLLATIDGNTDSIETQLTSIISEHDQTQVLINTTNTLLQDIKTIEDRILDALTLKGQTQYIVKLTNTNQDVFFGRWKVNYIDVIIIGKNESGYIEIDNAGNDLIDMDTEALTKYERNFETYENKVNPHDIAVKFNDNGTNGYMLVEFGLQ